MNEQAPHKKINLPQRDMVVSVQVGTLLGIIGSLYPYAASTDRQESQGGALDGGACMAASQTIVRACDRLDRILADDDRWNMRLQDTLEALMEKMYSANHEFLVKQAAAAAEGKRPSFQLRPQLVRASSGWAAIHGDLAKLEDAIIGVGETPEAALAHFDAVFSGQSPDTVELLKEENDKAKNLDAGTDQGTQSAPRNRRKPRRNRKSDGANEGGGEQQAQQPS